MDGDRRARSQPAPRPRTILTGAGLLAVLGLLAAVPSALPAADNLAAIEHRDAIIRDLIRRVEALEQGAASAARATRTAGGARSARREQARTPGGLVPGAEVSSTSRTAARSGDVVDETTERALERALVRESGQLLPPWTLEFGPEADYAYGARREVVVIDDDFIGQRRLRTDSLQAAIGFRLGLPWAAQAHLRIPYFIERTEDSVAGVGRARDDESGFGSVDVGLSKQLLWEQAWLPDVIATVNWKVRTNDFKRNDVSGDLRSGFHVVQGVLTATRRQDPLVFLTELSYATAFEEKKSGVSIDPGDSVGVRLGTILAASPETALRLAVDASFEGRLELDGRKVEGTDDVVAALELGVTSLLSEVTVLDLSVGVGLTDAAPDFRVGIALPIRF